MNFEVKKSGNVNTPHEIIKSNSTVTIGDDISINIGLNKTAPDTLNGTLLEGDGFFDIDIDEFDKEEETPAPKIKPGNYSSHKFKKGDTFENLAKKVGLSVEEFASINPKIEDINNIPFGTKINMPDKNTAISIIQDTIDELIMFINECEPKLEEMDSYDKNQYWQAKNKLNEAEERYSNLNSTNKK